MRVAIVTISMIFAAQALAQDAPAVPPQVTSIFPLGEPICFKASAEDGGIAKGKALTEFQMYRLFEPDPLRESVEFTRDEAIAFDKTGNNGNWVEVRARFKDKPYLYSQVVSCSFGEDSKLVRCGVDCDGGSFNVKPTAKGLDALLQPDQDGLSLNQSCGDPDDENIARWMTPEDSGGRINMTKMPPETCRAEHFDAKPAFVKNLAPIRERIDKDHWRCMARIYDKAHLAKHSQQKVAAMAVTFLKPAKIEREAGNYPSTSLAVRLSFITRDGKAFTRDTNCYADEYQFRCDGTFRLRRTEGDSILLLAGEGGEEAGTALTLIDETVGSDDKVFRLDAMDESRCKLD